MTDEADQLPGIFLVVAGAAAPGGHGAEPDSVLNDVKQLAIAELLGSLLAHIGSRWIRPHPDAGGAASIVVVTQGAVVRPMRPPFGQRLRRVGNRVLERGSVARDSSPARAQSDPPFQGTWLGLCAEPVGLRNPHCPRDGHYHNHREHAYNEPTQPVHVSSSNSNASRLGQGDLSPKAAGAGHAGRY